LVYLDIRDQNWFLERADRSAVTREAADGFCMAVAEPILSSRDLVDRSGEMLDTHELRAALLYLVLQRRDDDVDRQLTRLCFDGRHNVTDSALSECQILDSRVEKDDIFFYVYGVLHSPDYRKTFAADLKKSLPRIPQAGNSADFWAFSKAGQKLAELHTEYEQVAPWPDLEITYGLGFDADIADAYRVEKMRYPKVSNPDDPDIRKVDDKTTIIFNPQITVSGIPERAHDYTLGSRSAIDWILESYQVKTHKASGIVNDPNDWATEHNNLTYILDLIGRVVTVSMRTLDIVGALPKLDL